MSDQPVRLTLRGGGWILVVTGIVVAALLVWALSGVFLGHRPQGGGDLASYGFDLSTCLVPQEELVPTGQPRDFLRTLTATSSMPSSAMAEFNRTHRKHYVVSDDRVIGVVINGEARAYPLYSAQAHEVIEDTLGGTPIVVTYSPLSDSAAVYERTLDGTVLAFGVSGLLRDANTLLYDKSVQEGSKPSLWQQLDGRALSGPAAARGARLRPVPGIALTTFRDWQAAHPESTVIVRDEGKVRLYESISYTRDHAKPTIGFPVDPMPPEGAVAAKEPVLVVELNGVRRAYAIERARGQGMDVWTPQHGATTLTIRLTPKRGTARLEVGTDAIVTPTFWFGAFADLGVSESALVVP